jgi:hypothetical protein
MEQIDGHRVGLSHGIARGIAHGLISYHQSHEMISPFAFSATGTSKDKGVLSSTAFRNPETRSAKCKSAQKPFRHSGYREFKRQGSPFRLHCIGKPRNPKMKCKRRPKAISAFRLPGVQETRGAFFHCISKPRNPKREM